LFQLLVLILDKARKIKWARKKEEEEEEELLLLKEVKVVEEGGSQELLLAHHQVRINTSALLLCFHQLLILA
jgi:hypothetical protein